MIRFPNAKINLGLRVVHKREDGYHDLETCFYPIPFHDALEVLTASAAPADTGVIFKGTGIVATANPADNICVKAWHLLKSDYPDLPAVSIFLHKTIPTGAGLGGGSADGAFTLILLNEKYKLGIPPERLEAYALRLGSDCPFFIQNRPALAFGRGELLHPIKLSLKGHTLVLVHPGIHVSTADAFSRIKPAKPETDLTAILTKPIGEWRELLKNDFEESVFSIHPPLARIKEELYRAGALYAAMSGSGSSVFGLFDKTPPRLEFPGLDCLQKVMDLN